FNQLVRRVDEDEVEAAALDGEEAQHLRARSLGTREPELRQVAGDRPTRLAVRLHEDGARRAPGEGLEPHRARPGVEVEDRGAFHRADEVEGRLAYSVRGRSRPGPSRGEDARALPATRDDPHRPVTAPTMASTASSRDRPLVASRCQVWNSRARSRSASRRRPTIPSPRTVRVLRTVPP